MAHQVVAVDFQQLLGCVALSEASQEVQLRAHSLQRSNCRFRVIVI
jgi:hypothetical protein